jgi:hypothetical protein
MPAAGPRGSLIRCSAFVTGISSAVSSTPTTTGTTTSDR